MRWYTDKRVIAITIIAIIALAFIAFRGLNFGIEFTGGTRIPITLEKAVTQSTMDEIVNTIKLRTAKFGLTQVVARSVGDRQIYVEVPQSDPKFVAEIEEILKAEGKFEAIIDGKVAVTGDSIVSGSIAENPEISGDKIRWGVSFVITQEAAKKFADVAYGKANYPVYLFLDRVEDSSIIVRKIDISNENYTNDELKEAIHNVLDFGNNELIILDEPGMNISQIIQSSEKKTFVISKDEKDIIEILKSLNKTVIAKEPTDMRASYAKNELDVVNVEEWPAIGLLSAPYLSENLATGSVGQMYTIQGASLGASYEERRQYAIDQMKKIKSILSGGALPVRLELGSSMTVPPSLGKEFLSYSVVGAILAFIAVMAIVVIRYRKPAAIPPLIFTPVVEMILLVAILGGVGTLDLAAIAGLFSAMGSAVDAQIVVSDDLLSTKELTKDIARQKVKRSFYIITRDAAVLAVAVLPLLFSNLVEIIGFVTAMLLGTILNIIITTQVYDAFGKSISVEK
jgi:preprotein translocase subunit SecD